MVGLLIPSCKVIVSSLFIAKWGQRGVVQHLALLVSQQVWTFTSGLACVWAVEVGNGHLACYVGLSTLFLALSYLSGGTLSLFILVGGRETSDHEVCWKVVIEWKFWQPNYLGPWLIGGEVLQGVFQMQLVKLRTSLQEFWTLSVPTHMCGSIAGSIVPFCLLATCIGPVVTSAYVAGVFGGQALTHIVAPFPAFEALHGLLF